MTLALSVTNSSFDILEKALQLHRTSAIPKTPQETEAKARDCK